LSNEKIIYVDPELKIEQLVKEIINCDQKQVILEVPAKTDLLSNEINLRLIKFYAEEEEKDLIINAVNPGVISIAQRLGISTIREREINPDLELNNQSQSVDLEPEISVTPSIVKAERSTPKLPGLPRNIGSLLPAVLVALFSLILAFWWFIQPKVKIIVYPKEQYLNYNVQVEVGQEYSDKDIIDKKIPAKIFDTTAQLEVETKTSGEKIVGVTQATGKVTFINQTGQPVVIPKGTAVFGKSGFKFTTVKDVLVPKKATKYQHGIAVGEEYGRIDVEIIAEQKGTAGNHSAKSIAKIDPKYERMISVVNLTPTSGGTDKKIAVVALEDIKRSENEARSQMLMIAREDAQKLVSKDYLFLTELVELQLLKITSEPAVGAEADAVKTKLDYKLSVLSPSVNAIQKLLVYELEQSTPPNFEAVSKDTQLISAKVNPVNGRFMLSLTAKGKVRGVLNEMRIKQLIAGKSLAEAKELLTRQSEIAEYQIDGANVNKIPRFGFQIKVIFPAGAKEPIRTTN
jgi:hypothetical protein